MDRLLQLKFYDRYSNLSPVNTTRMSDSEDEKEDTPRETFLRNLEKGDVAENMLQNAAQIEIYMKDDDDVKGGKTLLELYDFLYGYEFALVKGPVGVCGDKNIGYCVVHLVKRSRAEMHKSKPRLRYKWSCCNDANKHPVSHSIQRHPLNCTFITAHYLRDT